jgi:hypothetical protein
MNHDRLSHFFRGMTMQSTDPAMPCRFGTPEIPPNLVACMIHPSLMFAAQGLYQQAYENALAATRTSRFEIASRVCPN